MFALPTLAVLNLHATPSQVGALIACETLAFPVLGMLVGVLADRLSRRRIMIVADLARFFALATIPIAARYNVLGMPQLYAVALITGTASAFFGISYQSYLPVIVASDRLTDANAKLEFSSSGSQVVGNALAGGLVQAIGAASAIALDAASYLASVASLMMIRAAEPIHEGPPLTARQGTRELAEGLRLVFRSPDLRWILATTASVNFGGAMANAIVLIYAYRVLNLQPGLLGVVFGLSSLGFVGALLSTAIRARFGLRATLIGSIVISGIASCCIVLASLGIPYVVLFLTSAITTIAVPVYNVNQVSYRQALVDVRLQGRLNATMRTFVWGTLPLGAWLGGYSGSLIGIPQTILLGSTLATLSALWLIPLRERSHDRNIAV